MTNLAQKVVVVGASAGGLAPLRELTRGLPADFAAAVCIVRHTATHGPELLADILRRDCRLPVDYATADTELEAGRIYVAPPDRHLLLKGTKIELVSGPKENGFRPAIDPLFRTAARSFGPNAVGIVLSGDLDDGTFGLVMIKRHGGTAMVQDPHEAEFPSMPQQALRFAKVDHVLPAAQVADVLAQVVRSDAVPIEQPNENFVDVAEGRTDVLRDEGFEQPPSPYRCPECHGALWETTAEGFVRYRCHTGHGFTAQTLGVQYDGAVEKALWTAVSVLEESVALHRRLVCNFTERNDAALSNRFTQVADEKQRHADTLRTLLVNLQTVSPSESVQGEYQ